MDGIYRPCGAGAEGDTIVGGGARKGGRGVVVGVTIGPGAGVLEELGVGRRLACIGVPKLAAAAVLGGSESLAGALARHALAPAVRGRQHHLEVRGTQPVEVHQAPRRAAAPTRAALRHHQHRQVVAVHEAHVIEVHTAAAVESELRQGGGGRRTAAGALHPAGTAVAGAAAEPAVGVYGAAGAAPEAARPSGGRVQAARLALLQLEARRGQRRRAGTREHAGPYGVVAVVR
ncbi:hypothetical protein B296_00009675 [Ensete ventricosum]|uniref:Uncharacterized protein n=1 Tax=Ensete ventricosum TaxID=4639 RepID=A0A427B6G6_ENSVE|nr:hypothetical protein B296_00009675 [Ensete ventricosum]